MNKNLIHIKNPNTALTLIETIIYVVLLGIFLVGVVQFLLFIREKNNIARLSERIQREGLFVVEHISQTTKVADELSEMASVLSVDNSKLVLLTDSESTTYEVIDGRLTFVQFGISHALTSPNVWVSKFFVEPINDSSGVIIGIRLELVVASGGVTDDFTTSILFNQ